MRLDTTGRVTARLNSTIPAKGKTYENRNYFGACVRACVLAIRRRLVRYGLYVKERAK